MQELYKKRTNMKKITLGEIFGLKGATYSVFGSRGAALKEEARHEEGNVAKQARPREED